MWAAESDTTSEQETEGALVAAIAAGDEDALVHFFTKHWSNTVGYALTQTRSRAQAEDLAAEAFLRTWEAVRKGAAPSNLRAYLFRAVRNLHIDQARRAARHPERELTEYYGDGTVEAVPDPAEIIVEKDTISTALRTLTPAQRTILWDTAVAGYSTAESAHRLSLATPNAGSQLALRARRSLQRAYGVTGC